MDKPKIRDMRPVIEAALKSVEERFGVKVKVGNASFTPNNVVFKVEFAELVDGKAVTKEIEDFKRNAVFFGLQPDDMGKTFLFRNDAYTVCGLAPKSRKAPVLARRTDGKVFKFPVAEVRLWLGHKRPEAEVLERLRRTVDTINRLTTGKANPWGPNELRDLMQERSLLIRELGRQPTAAELAVPAAAEKPSLQPLNVLPPVPKL
jgi:hypothetical protein